MLEAIPVLTGTEKTGFNFTVYTGDLVSHDPENQLSRLAVFLITDAASVLMRFRDYVMYAEVRMQRVVR